MGIPATVHDAGTPLFSPVGCQLCRSAGIGIGTARAVAPASMPASHVFGGAVPMPRVEGFSAAQNMKPSIPALVPAPLGVTDCTYGAVAFCSQASTVHLGDAVAAVKPTGLVVLDAEPGHRLIVPVSCPQRAWGFRCVTWERRRSPR